MLGLSAYVGVSEAAETLSVHQETARRLLRLVQWGESK